MKKLYVILAVVAVLAVAAVSYSVSSDGDMATALVDFGEELDDARLASLSQGLVMGQEGAPVTIVEFGDYQCPACGSFASVMKPQIEEAFVETGQARFVFYDFPIVSIHPNAFLAARAAWCAEDQDRGWDYHEMLFARQSEWAPSTNPAGRFVEYAGELGLDRGEFEDCLRSDRHADRVTANLRLGERANVSSTPTVLVGDGTGNSRMVPSNDIQAVREAVQSLTAASGGGPPGP